MTIHDQIECTMKECELNQIKHYQDHINCTFSTTPRKTIQGQIDQLKEENRSLKNLITPIFTPSLLLGKDILKQVEEEKIEIRKLILSVILECLEDTKCYDSRSWVSDFTSEVESKLEDL